ncbi:MAG: hypothetical protein DI626_01690 [Micavibrio aeruginosavorus]|uniref:Uncharacterized protein n=1 Tax=Micavibrio aeruginosavorus TaxID=349221 RepID=A0A2W5A1M3_9BACT|nr:MAG: hypothetical protein DI626_01690 [Micavibrio aeruginosavorus]
MFKYYKHWKNRRKASELYSWLDEFLFAFDAMTDKDKRSFKSLVGSLSINIMSQAGYINWYDFLKISRGSRKNLVKAMKIWEKRALEDGDTIASIGYAYVRSSIEASLLEKEYLAYTVEELTNTAISEYIEQITTQRLEFLKG